MKSAPTIIVTSRRNLSLSLAAAVALVLGSQGAQATELKWNTGPALWNHADANWTDGSGAVLWDSNTPDSAIFDSTGTPGAITLADDITVGNITFSAAGYSIAGGDYTLTLSNTTIGGTAEATISATLSGTTGLTVTNTAGNSNTTGTTGGVLLTGNNTYSGKTIVGSNAMLRLGSVGALGNSTEIEVNNGALIIATGNGTTVGAGTTLTLSGNGPGSNGALRGMSGAKNTWAGNIVLAGTSRITGGTGGGSLTISGAISESAAGSGVVFNRIGGAITVLNAVNTYTGDTAIFNAASGSTSILRLGVDNAINANSRLTTIGAASAGNAVVDLNGHVLTLRGLDSTGSPNATSSAFLIVRNDASSAASTLTVGDSAQGNRYVFGGAVNNGASEVSLVKTGNNIQVLAGANTYTGSTIINSGTLQVGAPKPASGAAHFTGSNGSLASTDIRVNNGSFVVDNTGTDNNSSTRLADTAHFTLQGGTKFEYRGSEVADSSETIGKFTLGNGLSTIDLQHGANRTAVVTVDELSRSKGGLGFIKAANLGLTASTNAARLMVTTAPDLVGTTNALDTGANSGVTDTKIVPFLVASSTGGSAPDTFVTYNSTTGLRPLSPDEFASSITDGANVRIAGTSSFGSDATINSLIVTSVTLSLSGTVTNTSGAFLFTGDGTTNVSNGTLALGDKEGLMTVSKATAVVTSRITGTNGLSFFGPGTLGLGSSRSTYSGETMLYSGIIVPQVSSTNSGATVIEGPFGTSTVVLAGSQFRTGSGARNLTTIGNELRIEADTNFMKGGGHGFEFSGPVTLKGGVRTLTNNSDETLTFSGDIGGTDLGDGLAIAGNSTVPLVLSGHNDYQGPTIVRSSTLEVRGSISASTSVSVENAGTLVMSGRYVSFDPEDQGRIGDSTPLTLGNSGGNGGALLKIDNTTHFDPFVETLGSLTLGNDAIIDLGEGDFGTILRFAESQGNLWSGTLSIYNWTDTEGLNGRTDQIYFGNSRSGLLAEQLTQIRIYSDAGGDFLGHGRLLETGELVVATIPEPSTALSLLAVLGGVLGGRRLRRRTTTRS